MTDSTGPNGTRSAAALLVDCLGVQGCERIFTVPGESFLAVLDALPERPLPAKISFVAAKSQFTPKEVETRDERQKLVFRVKLRLTEPSAVPQAKPGMPGAGYVRTADVDWPANLQ